MQTFVPEGMDFVASAQRLDYRRLGKQRVEAWQILQTISGESDGWRNHPAVKMWVGYETALSLYGAIMCSEWIKRGYKDTMFDRFYSRYTENTSVQYPVWLENKAMIISHQSNLIRKYPEHYAQYWPGVPDDLPYIWPA